MHPGGEGAVRGEEGEKPGDKMHHRRCGEVPTGGSVKLLFCLGLAGSKCTLVGGRGEV